MRIDIGSGYMQPTQVIGRIKPGQIKPSDREVSDMFETVGETSSIRMCFNIYYRQHYANTYEPCRLLTSNFQNEYFTRPPPFTFQASTSSFRKGETSATGMST